LPAQPKVPLGAIWIESTNNLSTLLELKEQIAELELKRAIRCAIRNIALSDNISHGSSSVASPHFELGRSLFELKQ